MDTDSSCSSGGTASLRLLDGGAEETPVPRTVTLYTAGVLTLYVRHERHALVSPPMWLFLGELGG